MYTRPDYFSNPRSVSPSCFAPTIAAAHPPDGVLTIGALETPNDDELIELGSVYHRMRVKARLLAVAQSQHTPRPRLARREAIRVTLSR